MENMETIFVFVRSTCHLSLVHQVRKNVCQI